jgi:aspartate aminotransferase
MQLFREKVALLARGLNAIQDVHCLEPDGTFYVFANVKPICQRLGLTSHGLAMYLLEGADDQLGVACLGGECFGEAGGGFLRFSCAEPDDRLREALEFLPVAFSREDRAAAYRASHPQHHLPRPYEG